MSTTVQVSFGPTYEPTLWDLRKRVAAARKADEDLIFITVTAPITSEVIEVAIESGSLYLVGVRACDKTWWEFAPRPSPGAASEQQPRLPNSRWIMAGALRAFDSYRGLRLDWTINQKSGAVGQIVYADRQIELLRFFRRWDGQLNGYDLRLSLCVLIFSLCEALRFRSIENTCARWIRATGADPVLLITKEMLDAAQNWHARSDPKKEDPDIWTWPPELPDLIVS